MNPIFETMAEDYTQETIISAEVFLCSFTEYFHHLTLSQVIYNSGFEVEIIKEATKIFHIFLWPMAYSLLPLREAVVMNY